MQRYELMFIISPKVKEADMRPAADQIQKMITAGGGKVIEELDWGKKKFAYPIKNYRHGFYYVLSFDTEPAAAKQLDNSLKQNDDLLRYLMIRLETSAVKALTEQKKRALAHPEEGEKETAENAGPAAQITPENPALAPVEAKPEHKTEKEPIVAIKTPAKPETTTVTKIAPKEESSVSQEKQEKAKLDELDKKLDEILDEDITN